jgi:hypothetical protein
MSVPFHRRDAGDAEGHIFFRLPEDDGNRKDNNPLRSPRLGGEERIRF